MTTAPPIQILVTDTEPGSGHGAGRAGTLHLSHMLARQTYVVTLTRCLLLYGAPTHRLEPYLARTARTLKMDAQFLYLAGCMLLSFDDRTTHTTEMTMVRVPGAGVDLGKLRDVHAVYKDVVRGRTGVNEAIGALRGIMARERIFGKGICIFTYGLASAFVAPFAFQAGAVDLPVAFVLGIVLGVLELVVRPRSESFAGMFEVVAAATISFLARMLGSMRGREGEGASPSPTFCFSALAQSGIALILPGYTMLCAALELQSGQMVAGTASLVGAVVHALLIGCGVTVGAATYGSIDQAASSATVCDRPMDRRWSGLFVPAFAACLCVLNQAWPRDMAVMVMVGTAGFAASTLAGAYLFGGNSQLSGMAGAFAIGLLANGHARGLPLARRVRARLGLGLERGSCQARAASGLAAAAMLPGIFVLVPSGLASGGSLLAGVTAADLINGGRAAAAARASASASVGASAASSGPVADAVTAAGGGPGGGLASPALAVLLSAVEVAIGIGVGLLMGTVCVYGGKRRSGLMS